MGKINNYASATPTLSDKVIGTDADNNNETVNFELSEILSLSARAQFVNHIGGLPTPTTSTAVTSLTWASQSSFNVGFVISSATEITSSVSGVFNFRVEYCLTKSSLPISSPYVVGVELIINGAVVSGSRRMSNVTVNALQIPCVFNIAASVSAGDVILFNIRASDNTLSGYFTGHHNVTGGSGGGVPAHLLLITQI